ncbi:MAG: 16S rRNA (uracil(1498)-N(3))-methyltransferase [Gammaproteobacteria bacterium]|nr:16S rRNA (uracil(1498)-N(3))-methyltransferase [Gammaproteobacteria bacterium]
MPRETDTVTRRAFIDSELAVGEEIRLEDDAFRHLCKVLRLREGDEVTLFNGRGGEFHGRITAVEKRSATVTIEAGDMIDRSPGLEWQLLQAVSKGDRMDYTLQKSTELGVHSIQPFHAERSVVNLSGDRARKREEHWRGVVRSACEQCGMNRVPEIRELADIREALSRVHAETRLLLDPRADDSISGVEIGNSVALLIGPEGGLSDAEIAAAGDAGFRGIRMGSRILRTETAAVVAAAVLLARTGDLD